MKLVSRKDTRNPFFLEMFYLIGLYELFLSKLLKSKDKFYDENSRVKGKEQLKELK